MKSTKSVLLIALFTASLLGNSVANTLDLSTCTYPSGVTVPADECAVYRQLEERKQALAAQHERERQEAREKEVKLQVERDKAALELRQRHEAALKQEREQSDKRLRQYEAQRAIEDKQYEQAQKRAQAAEAAARATCGDDFKSPRVGMSLERAKQCVGKFKMVAQINRADGVVTTYRGNAGTLHVMQGVVVAWSK